MANFRELLERTELEWEELEAVGWDLLLDNAAILIDYTTLNVELARITGQPTWDFSNPADRNAIAHLLGQLADRSYAECLAAGSEPVMISALCSYKGGTDAGGGFYGKAVELHLMPQALLKDLEARRFFWADHVGKVQAWKAERETAAYADRRS